MWPNSRFKLQHILCSMADPATEATRQGPDPAADSEGLSTVAATLKQTAPILASYALPFLLIVYLAFNGGGYGVVVRSEIGIVAWWIVLVGSLCSVLPVSRPTRQAAIALALLAGLLFWTAFALIWTDSIGRTVLELSRIAALLGVLTLVVFASGRDSLRRTLAGAAAAIAVVALVAVLSRLQPGWFPEVSASRLLPGADYRLYYPLGYWNGLAALMAIGLPLSLWMATRARWIWTRSVAAASVPVLCLVVYYTFSRGGILAAIAGLLAFVLLSPGRLSMLPALVPAAIGSAIILAGAEQRSELADSTIGSTIGSTTDQGGELTLILLVVCFGVGLLQAGVALSERNGLLPQLRISGRAATVGATAALALLAVLAVALNAPGRTGDAWSEFRDNSGDLSGQSRLTSSAGNSRYQYWQASMEAFEQHPLVGQGPGTFEIWWAKNGTVPKLRSPSTLAVPADACGVWDRGPRSIARAIRNDPSHWRDSVPEGPLRGKAVAGRSRDRRLLRLRRISHLRLVLGDDCAADYSPAVRRSRARTRREEPSRKKEPFRDVSARNSDTGWPGSGFDRLPGHPRVASSRFKAGER